MNAVAVSTLRFGVHATPASALGPSDEAFDVPRAGAKKIEEIDISLPSTRRFNDQVHFEGARTKRSRIAPVLAASF
jgi:hypothetical protein